jgi:Na+/H+ antiporter NhaD/arsenite permease-like protein
MVWTAPVLLKLLADQLLALTGGDLTATTMTILWASAILSAFVDNIPVRRHHDPAD